jgi:subtilisin
MARRQTGSRAEPVQVGGYELQPGVLITFDPESASAATAAITNSTGVKDVAYAADFASAADMNQLRGAGMTVFANLGVAVSDMDPDQQMGVSNLATSDAPIMAVEQEPIFFAFQDDLPGEFGTYLRGYKDAVDHLYRRAFESGQTAAGLGPQTASGNYADSQQTTWGLQACRIDTSTLTGRGVKVAILDTGIDLDHPDFRGRSITHESFIPGQTIHDENGHGTHCIGTACGPRTPIRGPRYGIAHEAEIFAGKVLTNQGSALGRSTLAGIEWAVRHGCHIISMSLGGLVLPGQAYSTAFEATARAAMQQGALIIAACGNDSRRSQGVVRPVSNPANCPSIMAVAALDRSMRVADFSNDAINPDAMVDIAAPGVEIYSSAPEPGAPPQPPYFRQWAAQYDTISGTSMATPHVAGIAALLKEANPNFAAGDLWRLLVSRATPLSYPAKDAGAGLAQV